MSLDPAVDALFARFVEHHVTRGERLLIDDLVGARVELRPALEACIQRYLELDGALDTTAAASPRAPAAPGPLPSFDGFETIERIGAGGMGEVFKLKDLRLDRFVAAKVLRPDTAAPDALKDLMTEARRLALFKDEGIVQIYELRADATPPAILMEYIEGFPLGRVGPSLEFVQRARVLLEVCEALQRAHAAGLQHRDLKPTNILLDARLRPKLVDFGLAGGDPRSGHFCGTLHYLAPEQLDPAQPIDARADVYALGVVFYELLCGALPYAADALAPQLALIRGAQPRLPVELDPTVPEPLQAIALKAMETDPLLRYATPTELASDLRRFLDGRPVLARPSHYASALGRRLRPHLDAVDEWLRLKLIYAHEADRLRDAYARLEARDDDWIVESRRLSYSQIFLYLGALLLISGGLLYFAADRLFGAHPAVLETLLVLGLPVAGLHVAALRLYRRQHKAVAVAYFLGSAVLVPPLLLTALHAARWFEVAPKTAGQLFESGDVSNRQLQLALLATAAWCAGLALRTRTAGLSAVTTAVTALFYVTLLGDFGLRARLNEGRYDVIAVQLLPLLALFVVAGIGLDRRGRAWFAQPLYVAAAVIFVGVLELSALDGRLFAHLGLSMAAYGPAAPANRTLLDTLTAMSLSGIAFYGVATAVDLRGSRAARLAALLLFSVSPFGTLEPVAYLVQSGAYARGFDWLYLLLALAVAVASSHRERRSFYYAGLVNTAVALWLLTGNRHWFAEPWWAVTVIGGGLAVLGLGLALDVREQQRRRVG